MIPLLQLAISLGFVLVFPGANQFTKSSNMAIIVVKMSWLPHGALSPPQLTFLPHLQVLVHHTRLVSFNQNQSAHIFCEVYQVFESIHFIGFTEFLQLIEY